MPATNQNIVELAKNHLFYFYNGLRYLIRSSKEDCLQLVRKGDNGDANHITVLFSAVDVSKFAVLISSFGVLGKNGHSISKYKKDDLYISPLLGISADEVRALHASGQHSIEMDKLRSRISLEETVQLCTQSILNCVDETHVSIFIYKPAEAAEEAISQFFSLKGFWVETEKNAEDGNVRFTFYW